MLFAFFPHLTLVLTQLTCYKLLNLKSSEYSQSLQMKEKAKKKKTIEEAALFFILYIVQRRDAKHLSTVKHPIHSGWLCRRPRDSRALSETNKLGHSVARPRHWEGLHKYLHQLPRGRHTPQLHTSSISISALLPTKPDLHFQNQSWISPSFILLNVTLRQQNHPYTLNHPIPVNLET